MHFCEARLAEHGDNYLGVGWTKRPDDADLRYQVMLDVVRERPEGRVTLLDFGSGAGHLYDYMLRTGVSDLHYSGLDISPRFLDLARSKHPDVTFHHLDVAAGDELPEFDYIVMNGVFTMKCELSFDEMLEYFKILVARVFARARVGLAFNVMSKEVEWERDDLFHLPLDVLSHFLAENLSRRFVIRHDYPLYEYTAYVYH